MRRFAKILVLMAACSAALVLTIRHGGDGIRVGADNQLRAAMRGGNKYDLAQLPIFSRTLFYVRENYFDKNRLDPKRMLVGATEGGFNVLASEPMTATPTAFDATLEQQLQAWSAQQPPGGGAA